MTKTRGILALAAAVIPVVAITTPALATNDHGADMGVGPCNARASHHWTSSTVYASTAAYWPTATCKQLYVAAYYMAGSTPRTASDYASGGTDSSAYIVVSRPSGFGFTKSVHTVWADVQTNCGTYGCEWVRVSSSKTLF